ncbi:MAG: hypothetical protein R3E93_10610 [Thiothrix sp.]
MQQRLILVLSSLILLLSNSAFAHNGLFAHPHTGNEMLHLFVHMLMVLPVAAGAFFLGRWLFRRKLREVSIRSDNKR